jgi:ubiquinone/menaquinone biosynthesis C-methylase UbiE
LACVCANAQDYDVITAQLPSNVAKYDHIMFSFTLHYIPNIKESLKYYSDLLVQNGTMIILYIDTSDADLLDKINKSDDKY